MSMSRVWENSACFTKPGAKDKEVTKKKLNFSFNIFLVRSVFAIKTVATRTLQVPERPPES